MKKTIKEMFKYNHTGGRYVHILPINTGYNWWAEYESNIAVFDRAFATRFSSFTYEPLLDDPENINELLTAFCDDVESIFAKNAKKYSELFRIHTIDDDDIPLTYNYDLHETMSRQTSEQDTSVLGQRVDTNIDNSNESMNRNTSDNSAVITGQRTDINNVNVGSQKQENVNKVTAFNTNNENTNNSSSSEVGSRNDITQFTKGQETDTTQGTGTETYTLGKNDDITFTKGQETDTSNSSGTENYTLDRRGNIGTQNAFNILEDAMNLFSRPDFTFYNIIFDDICSELLQIGG